MVMAWVACGWVILAPQATAAVVRREAVALEGQPAPGGLPGETFGPLARVRARLNSRGDVVFIAPIRGVRTDGSIVDGLFVRTDQGLFRLAQEDTQVPGLSSKVFGRLSKAAINDAGNVLVFSQRSQSEAYFSNASGAWRVVAQSDLPEEGMRRFHQFSLLDQEHQWQPMLRSSTEPDILFAALPVPGVIRTGRLLRQPGGTGRADSGLGSVGHRRELITGSHRHDGPGTLPHHAAGGRAFNDRRTRIHTERIFLRGRRWTATDLQRLPPSGV
ncbi:MAG: hypothetical protein IT581_12530 [Verrucomicrobiales bacterium]|nr:hypothetical protein [Verrucomicrobiales bacterium]